jgi:hypothetical protein
MNHTVLSIAAALTLSVSLAGRIAAEDQLPILWSRRLRVWGVGRLRSLVLANRPLIKRHQRGNLEFSQL